MIKKELVKEKQKLGFSGWLEIIVFVLSALHLTFLLLNLFNVFNIKVLDRSTFNYIIAFILLGVCLILYFLLMLLEKVWKFNMPNWLKCMFYIGFFVFTNIYYTFGLFEIFWTIIAFYVYLGFILNIISLSVFFNLQKTDNGIIKTNNVFVATFIFCASVATATLIEIIIASIKLLTNASLLATTFIANLCAIILVSLLMSTMFYLSLAKSKKIINKCLIK